MSLFNTLFGYVMKLCYSISFSNYIVALFFFALIMQIVLFPLGIKQQKSSVLLSKIRPKENAIRNKYKGRNDRATQQKMNMEIQEMYKAEGYSPTAGCLPLLIQLPLILILFNIVQSPLTYTTDLNNSKYGEKVVVVEATEKTEASERAYTLSDFYQRAYSIVDNQTAAYGSELNKLVLDKQLQAGTEKLTEYAQVDTFTGNKDNESKEGYAEAKALADSEEYKSLKAKITKLSKTKKQLLSKGGYRQMYLINFMQKGVDGFYADFTVDGVFTLTVKSTEDTLLSDEKLGADVLKGDFMQAFIAKTDATSANKGEVFYDFNDMLAAKKVYDGESFVDGKFVNGSYSLPNFTFIGDTTTLDTPSYTKFNWLIIIPVLVFLSSFFSGEITRKLTVQPTGPDGKVAGGGGMMKWGMPLISTYFSFTFPAAIGIYWIFRSIFAVGQQFLLCKMYPPQKLSAEELKEATKEVKQAKKRKKLITIEVDEDDTSYDDIAISEERAEKLRRRREKQLRDADLAEKAEKEPESGNKIDRPQLKDEPDRKDK